MKSLSVYVDDAEDAALRAEAEKKGTSISNLFRAAKGMPENSTARPNAGRPPKKSKKK